MILLAVTGVVSMEDDTCFIELTILLYFRWGITMLNWFSSSIFKEPLHFKISETVEIHTCIQSAYSVDMCWPPI